MKTICITLGLLAAFNMAPAASQQKPIENKDALLSLKSYVAKDGGYAARSGTNNYQYRYDRDGDYQWADGVGGSGSYGDRFEASDNDLSRLDDQQRQMSSPASEYPPAAGFLTNVSHWVNSLTAHDFWSTNESEWSMVVAPEHCAVQARVGDRLGWPAVTYGSWMGTPMDPLATGKYWRKADTTMKLETGGRGKSKQKSLFCLSATAADRTNKLSCPSYWDGSEVVWSDPATLPLPATSIEVDGKALGSDGKLWQVYADNQTIDVTPKVAGKDYYSFTVAQQNLRLDLRWVSFDGMGIQRDQDGTAYATPHWTNGAAGLAGPVQSHPTLYVSGSRVGTSTGFEVRGNGGFEVIIKGEASGGATSFTLWGTNAPSGTSLVAPTTAAVVLTTNKVDFYAPMNIKWSYAAQQANQPLEFLEAGMSTNQVYVSRKTPTTANLYHTVVHVACDNAKGQTVESNIVAGIWTKFAGRTVPRWNETDGMKYWGPTAVAHASPPLNDPLISTHQLVKHADGQCGSWARFFRDTVKVHGITGSPLRGIRPSLVGHTSHGLWVKHQNITPIYITPPSYPTPFPGVAGQNNPDPRSAFFDHAVVTYNGSIYDPSYGTGTFTTLLDWQQSSLDVVSFDSGSVFFPVTIGGSTCYVDYYMSEN